MSERAKGLGLRAQIALILGTALSLSCVALFALSLQQEANTARRLAEARAQTLLLGADTALFSRADEASLAQRLNGLIGTYGVVGALVGTEGRRVALGEQRGSAVDARSPSGRVHLRLWTEPTRQLSTRPWARVLLAYFALTGGAVVLLAWGALTRLIVAPVANLTNAARELESGALQTRVPVRGAREVAQLGLSFNSMARQLNHDREALADKVGALERTTVELKSAQEQVVRSEKLASVGRLSAGLAHEIGNPLSAILGLVELLREGGLSDAEQREFLSRVHGETERIHRVLRELLDFARQKPATPGESASADLGSVIDDTLRLLRPQLDARGIVVTVRGSTPWPRVMGSADELSQVLLNVLLNAGDAIAGKGDVALALDADDDAVTLSITDSGPGIPAAILSTLFEPFVTTKAEGKGTGLGLAVCQGIVSRLGGRIDAHNTSAGGACFRVRLPRARDAA